jgi:hypothetical protein
MTDEEAGDAAGLPASPRRLGKAATNQSNVLCHHRQRGRNLAHKACGDEEDSDDD